MAKYKLKYLLEGANTSFTVTSVNNKKVIASATCYGCCFAIEDLVAAARKILQTDKRDSDLRYEVYTDFEYSYKDMEAVPVDYVRFTYKDFRFEELVYTLTIGHLMSVIKDRSNYTDMEIILQG